MANENRITSVDFPLIAGCECLCFQHVPHGDSDRKTTFAETKCGKVYHAFQSGLKG